MLHAVKNANVEVTTSVDINGVNYPTVTIGGQEWTAVNYRGPGGVAVGDTLDTAIYGRYYGKADLNNITLPTGWRIPTKEDFITLLKAFPNSKTSTDDTYVAYIETSSKLRSTSGWYFENGDNSSGFNAFPGGYYDSGFKQAIGVKVLASFLTTTPGGVNVGNGNFALAIFSRLSSGDDMSGVKCDIRAITPQNFASLRFVKDK